MVSERRQSLSGPPVPPDAPALALSLPGIWLAKDVSMALAQERQRRLGFYLTAWLGAGLLISAAASAMLRASFRHAELTAFRSQLVASVSHELKTPLTVIRLFTEMLRQGYSGGEAERDQALGVIERECENLSLLIDNILGIAKIEAGSLEYLRESLDLGDLVRQWLAELRPFLDANGFSVKLDAADGLPPLVGDPQALRHLFRNLISNAVKFSEARREIDVSIKRAPEGIELSVADRGVGLAPGDERRLFQPFFRGKAGAQAPGTGLGLALVAHVAQGHGGQVRAAPRPGGGSIFSCLLGQAQEREKHDSM